MKTYRATKDHAVKVYGGLVEVKTGDLVSFAGEPGDGWEEVKDGSDPRPEGRAVGSKRNRHGNDGGSV